MSNNAASSRGGSSSRRSPPRMAEDRDATVSHRARPGGLGLPPLVMASTSSYRGRGRGSGRGIGFGAGAGSFHGRPPMGRNSPIATGSNTLPTRPNQYSNSGWTRSADSDATADTTAVPPHLRPYGSRPIDTYIPPSRPPATEHRRWNSPPTSVQPEPRQVTAGPSNYAPRPPPPAPRIPPSGPSAHNAIPVGPRATIQSVQPVSSTSTTTTSINGTSQIAPMKFRPNLPKSNSIGQVPTRNLVPTPGPSKSMAGSKMIEEDDEESAMNGPVAPATSVPPAPVMDEKEDIEMEEEDVKPDITIIESEPSNGRQNRNTIDDSRNDGVLAWSPHQLPECFPPNKPPGRTKARQAWRSMQEIELKAKGIKVVRALWRDDGVGIHWERLAQPRSKKVKPPSSVIGSVSPEKPTSKTSTSGVRPRTPSISTSHKTQFPVSPSTPGVQDLSDLGEIIAIPSPPRSVVSAATVPSLARPVPASTPATSSEPGPSRSFLTPKASTPSAPSPSALPPQPTASGASGPATSTPRTAEISSPIWPENKPLSQFTKAEKRALKQSWEATKRKRFQEETEEALANNTEPPAKKNKKGNKQRKRERAQLEKEEAEATKKAAAAAANAAKAEAKTASKLLKADTKTQDSAGKRASPFTARPLLSPIASASSSSSIDPPKPKRLVPLAEARPAGTLPVRPVNTAPPVARPVSVRPVASGNPSGKPSTGLPPRPSGPVPSAARPAPVRPAGAVTNPRPPPIATTRPPNNTSTAPKPIANPTTSITNPIRPYQSAHSNIMNPIRPYRPPGTTPNPTNPTRPPSSRPQASSARPPAQQSSSSSQTPSMRPPPSLGGAPRPTLPVRPNMSRSITPSNPSTRYNELKECLRTKMEEMDNWTTMLTDMPDNVEPIERQIVRTRKECFDLQKQMREERERTGVSSSQT